MSAEDLHEVQFKWPHPEPTTVIVTGTFDDWSSSIYLKKTPAGFEGTTKIPWGEKIKFKFVVDGKWIIHEDQPTETDPGGFVNNVYNAPPHPSNAEVTEPVREDVQPTTSENLANGDSLVTKIVEKPADELAVESAPDDKPIVAQDLTKAEDNVVAESEHQRTDIPPPGFPQLLSDLANTIVARDGTSSALDYVASGLGAAMHGVVGIDPINIQKIAIPTPVDDGGFTLPRGHEEVAAELASDSAPPAVDPDTPLSPLAPRVPITIVPVNAAENNMVSSSSPAAEINSPIPIIDAGPAVVVTEHSPTPLAGPQINSEAIFAPIPSVVEPDAQPFAEEKAIKADMPSQDTVAIPVLLEVDSVLEPTSNAPEPVRAATESVAIPVTADPAVDPETATAAEVIPTIAEVEVAAPTEAGIPAATKTESSSTVTESTTEPEVIAAVEPVQATTEVVPIPDETAGVYAERKDVTLAPLDVFAVIEDSTAVVAPVSEVVQPTVVAEGLPDFIPEPGPGLVLVADAPTMEANMDDVPLDELPKAEDLPAIVVEESEVDELLVETNIVEDDTSAPVVGRTSPGAVNETLVPAPTPSTASLVEATAVEQVKVTDTPIIVEGEKVTGVDYAVIAEPVVEEHVKQEEKSNHPEPNVPAIVVENIKKPVESFSGVQQSLREIAPVSQELAPTPSVQSTPAMIESTDAAAVDETKPSPAEVTCEVGKGSASELEAVEPTPTAVAAAVEARAPPVANESVATEPFSVVDEVTLTKEHGQANGTTTEPEARGQLSTNGHGAPPEAIISTQGAATHAEKFPSASALQPAPEDISTSSSKFNSTRKKRTSLFGKLKNIFHPDKEKEKK